MHMGVNFEFSYTNTSAVNDTNVTNIDVKEQIGLPIKKKMFVTII